VLVVQADYYNQKISNVLVASITSNLARQNDSAHYYIGVSSSEGKLSGLTQDSLVSCLNLATLPISAIGPRVGELSAAAMLEIDKCLKASLGIP
jgi:mRNA-degrading endonuclease toxin of MazEF toxin-antitoxin module